MKNILILVFSNLKHDARVSRQINFLKKNYKVTVVCFEAEDDPAVEIIRVKPTKLTLLRKAFSAAFLLSRFYTKGYRLIYDYDYLKKEFASKTFHLIIANDVETLPLAFELKKEGEVLFDAHEYAPRHFENNLMWKIFFKGMNNYLCRKYIPLVKGMTTVSSGLAEEYEKNFGVKPLILTNASRYCEVNIKEPEKEKIKLIHHGIANRARNLELMIDMMKLLDDRFTLDLMLMVPGSASANTRNYLQELKDKTANDARIKIVPPVKSSEIVETINKYDVGVFLIPPINFNYAHTLPNKLFDFIQARLAIAIGPTPDMAAIIRRFDNGIIADDFTPASLAKKLNSLTAEKILYYKRQSLIAAGEVNAEKNEILINKLVEKIL